MRAMKAMKAMKEMQAMKTMKAGNKWKSSENAFPHGLHPGINPGNNQGIGGWGEGRACEANRFVSFVCGVMRCDAMPYGEVVVRPWFPVSGVSCRKHIEHISNIYRTSVEHRSMIYRRKYSEHLPNVLTNIYTSIESVSSINRIEHPTRKSIDQQLKLDGGSIA